MPGAYTNGGSALEGLGKAFSGLDMRTQGKT